MRSRSDDPAPTVQPVVPNVIPKKLPGGTAMVCAAAPNGPTNCVAAAPPTTALPPLEDELATNRPFTLTNVNATEVVGEHTGEVEVVVAGRGPRVGEDLVGL